MRNREDRDGAVRVIIAPSQLHRRFAAEVPRSFSFVPKPRGRGCLPMLSPAILLFDANNLFYRPQCLSILRLCSIALTGILRRSMRMQNGFKEKMFGRNDVLSHERSGRLKQSAERFGAARRFCRPTTLSVDRRGARRSCGKSRVPIPFRATSS